VREDFNIIPIVVVITQLLVAQMVELGAALPSVKIGTVATLTIQLVLMLLLEALCHSGLMEDAHLGLHLLCAAILICVLKSRISTKRALTLGALVRKPAAKFSTIRKQCGLPQLMWDAAIRRHAVPFAIMLQLET
jgi:hypothetical protein